MWITLFTIVIGIALGLAMGAIVMESDEKASRPYGRRSARNLRPVRNP
ncbi:MAG TPA: hypothetical protein VIV34_10050 [Pseudolabrys sp.]